MTTRLYYADSMLSSFDAVVRTATADGAISRVVLDRTAFYPTSGGQPFDIGTLGGLAVVDVVDREDGEVEHHVEGELTTGQAVAGQIDWARRFDHMQQHTGQHVLSAAFEADCGAQTLSFHLGRESSTIDLHREVSSAEVERAEALACQVVFDDRPVSVRLVSEAEAAALPLRKAPARSGELRIVEVADFDVSACGGTHVPSAGRIGVVAVSGAERFKGGTRVSFVCGGRALASHRRLRGVVSEACRLLSVSDGEIASTIERVLGDSRLHMKSVKLLHEELAVFRAAEFRATAETIGPYRVVLTVVPDADAQTARAMASAIVSEPGLVAVVVGAGSPAPVVAARSADVLWDAGHWIRQATERLGGRGGGKPAQAQGGIAAEPGQILDFARNSLAEAT